MILCSVDSLRRRHSLEQSGLDHFLHELGRSVDMIWLRAIEILRTHVGGVGYRHDWCLDLQWFSFLLLAPAFRWTLRCGYTLILWVVLRLDHWRLDILSGYGCSRIVLRHRKPVDHLPLLVCQLIPLVSRYRLASFQAYLRGLTILVRASIVDS